MDLYSASILDLATTYCFLELQAIKLPLKNTQFPLVERRSSSQLAQSASAKSSKDREYHNPLSTVPHKYLKTLL